MSRRKRSRVESRAGLGGLLGDLVHHEQGVVTEPGADLDALAAALAVARVDEDAEGPAGQAAPRGDLAVLLRINEVAGRGRGREDRLLRRRGEGRDPALELRGGHDGAQDGGVRAGADAGHAAHALLGDELGDARCKVAEVAHGRRARGNDAAGQAGVRRQLPVGDPPAVGRDDRQPEVLDVLVHVQERRREHLQALVVMLLHLARVLDQQVGHRAGSSATGACGRAPGASVA
jgi:hypothetical protein